MYPQKINFVIGNQKYIGEIEISRKTGRVEERTRRNYLQLGKTVKTHRELGLIGVIMKRRSFSKD